MAKSYFPSNFPEQLIRTGISLDHLGIIEIAWDKNDAIAAISFLCNSGYIILGGDVYVMDNGCLQYTYDNWFFEPRALKDHQNIHNYLIQKSKDKAIHYVNQYYKMNGDKFYYTVVFADESECKSILQ
jgi:hypothetical protein